MGKAHANSTEPRCARAAHQVLHVLQAIRAQMHQILKSLLTRPLAACLQVGNAHMDLSAVKETLWQELSQR
jgi:DNA-binding FrmR family transcriptional regulator